MRFLLPLLVLVLALAPGLAAADPDVAALRTQLPASHCELGAVYAKRNDLPRAALFLDGCDTPAAHDIKRKLASTALSSLDIVVHPGDLAVEVDSLPGETLRSGVTVWLPAGKHRVRASRGDRVFTQDITTEPHKGSTMIIETHLDDAPKPARTGVIDFVKDDDGHAVEHQMGSPENIKHGSMLSKRMQGIPDDPSGPAIDDPLALHQTPYTTRDLWLGARLGGGMFDDAATSARAGIALALTARYRLADRLFVAARTDWSRRGGDAIDVLGASAGLGTPITDELALTAQLRGDLRLASSHDSMPVSRTGLGAAIAAELALPSTPLSLGLRFEQAFTELVPGARDRAVLAEIGIDWR